MIILNQTKLIFKRTNNGRGQMTIQDFIRAEGLIPRRFAS